MENRKPFDWINEESITFLRRGYLSEGEEPLERIRTIADHAEKILKEGDERIVSSLMPCRVAIYEKPDGKVYISRMNSGLMAKTMGGIIAEVMSTASKENEEILNAIIKK